MGYIVSQFEDFQNFNNLKINIKLKNKIEFKKKKIYFKKNVELDPLGNILHDPILTNDSVLATSNKYVQQSLTKYLKSLRTVYQKK